jgi:hypothetical protein
MKHFINNTEIAPVNLFDIGINVNFEADVDQNKLTTDTIKVNRVEFAQGKELNFAIDFTNNYRDFGNEAEINLRPIKSHDHFFDDAQGLSFELVNTKIPFIGFELGYQIIPKDATAQGITISITLFMITVAIADQTRETAKTTKEFSVIIAYSPFPLGKTIEAGIQLAIQIAYLAILVYQALQLADRLFNLVFPKVRYLKACTVAELLEKSCQYLGYTFKSKLIQKDYNSLSILPIPLNTTNKKWYELFSNDINVAYQKCYPSANDVTPTLGTLLNTISTMFNGHIRVYDKEVYLERWDYWQNANKLNLKQPLNVQDLRKNVWSFDTSKLFKRYYIHYAVDYSDQTTLDNYENTNAEYSQDLISGATNEFNLIKGLTDINIPFARGKAKFYQSWLEKQFTSLFEEIDKLAGTNYAYKVNKKGNLVITEQFFSTTKLFMWDGAKKISQTQETKLHATYLWDNYHSINSIDKNQFIIYENVKIPMTSSEFVEIYKNNYVTIEGVSCKIISLQYFDNKNFAIISFKMPKNLIKNSSKLTKLY